MTPQDRERGKLLRDYVEAVKGKPITWSVDDCSPWVAQWVSNLTGKEFDWPVYSSRDEAEAIIAENGGLAVIWDRLAKEAGIQPRYDGPPEVGDVGIIDTTFGHVGGIFAFAGTFCWRAEKGARVIGVRPKHIVKVWQV